jgi:hypothetical protein
LLNPGAELSLYDLLALAALSGKGCSLLLIIEQFAEFLILNKPGERAPFAAFLRALAMSRL